MLQPFAVLCVLLELGPMAGFGKRVTLDVSFVIRTEEKGSWVMNLSVVQKGVCTSD